MKREPLWSPHDDRRLIRLSKAFVPVAEIAAQLGKSYSQVVTRRMYWKRQGTLKRLGYHDHRRWTRAEELALIDLWQGGKTPKWLAHHFGRTRTAILLKLKHLGVQRRRDRHTVTATEAAAMLGVGCGKTIVYWIELGWVKGHQNTSGKRNSVWRIDPLQLWGVVENRLTWMAWRVERIADPDLQAHAREHRPPDSPRWLSVGEVARRYHVGIGTVNQWINEHRLPAEKYGNWWIWEPDLAGFMVPADVSKKLLVDPRMRYRCCNRRLPLELVFSTDPAERVCPRCRPRYGDPTVYQLQSGGQIRIWPGGLP